MDNVILTSQKRIAWIDNSKAFAILFIVLGHMLSSEKTYLYLYSFHVILFFFLSGVTFNSKKDFGEFIVGKFKTIMLPYYIFSVISIVIYSIIGSYTASVMGRAPTDLSVKECIIGMLYASRGTGLMKWNTPLWFLPCLFCLFIIFYFIGRVILKSGKPIAYILTMIGFTVLMLANILFFHIYNLPFGLDVALNISPFFMAGICVRRFKLDELVNKHLSFVVRLLIAVLFIIAGILISPKNGYVNVSSNAYNNVGLFILNAVLGTAGWSLAAGLFKNKVVSYVGKNTMPILLMHKFPIMFLGTVLPQLNFSGNLYICLPGSVVIIAMCLGVGWIIERFAPFVIGKRKSA